MAQSETESALAVLKDQVTQLRTELTAVTTDRDKWKANHEKLSTEHKEAKTAAGTAETAKARIAELEGQLRTVTHKGEFAKAAKSAGVREEAIDDLFTLSGYKAEKDAVDPKAFETILTEAKEKRPYAFLADDAAGEAASKGSAMSGNEVISPGQKNPAGQGRGSAATTAQKGFVLTGKHLADPKFMLDKRNAATIKGARVHLPDREAQ